MVESQWRALYRAAILELDPKRLQARVKAAEDAIHERSSSEARVSPRGAKRNGRRVVHFARFAKKEVVTILDWRGKASQRLTYGTPE